MVAADWWRDFFSGLPVEFWLRYPTAEQTRDEADFIEKALGLPAGARVLDVPCGGGRHALELAARGHRPTGVDLSEDFLKAAQQAAERRLAVAWERRPMDELAWAGEFDGAYCFGNSFGYLDDAGNARFLKAVARALKPGGRFALDTGLTAEGMFPTFQERRWLQVGDILFFSLSRYDPARGRIDSDYTFLRDGKGDTRPASFRVYLYRELCGLLEEAGFGGCEGYSSLTREPFRLGAPRLLLVATRK